MTIALGLLFSLMACVMTLAPFVGIKLNGGAAVFSWALLTVGLAFAAVVAVRGWP